MAATKANKHTITRLYTAYVRQGIPEKEAVKLIAASLSLDHADVQALVDRTPQPSPAAD